MAAVALPCELVMRHEAPPVSQSLPDRVCLARVPQRYRGQVPPEIPALWEDPGRLRDAHRERRRDVRAGDLPALLLSRGRGHPGRRSRTIRPASGWWSCWASPWEPAPSSSAVPWATRPAIGAGSWWQLHRACSPPAVSGLVLGEDGLLRGGPARRLLERVRHAPGRGHRRRRLSDQRAVQDMGIGLGLGAWAVAQVIGPFIQDTSGRHRRRCGPSGSCPSSARPCSRSTSSGAGSTSRSHRRPGTSDNAMSSPKRCHRGRCPLTAASFFIVLLPGRDVACWRSPGLAVLGAASAVMVHRACGDAVGEGLLPGGAAPARMIVVAMFVGVFMSFAVNAPLHVLRVVLAGDPRVGRDRRCRSRSAAAPGGAAPWRHLGAPAGLSLRAMCG